MAGTIRRSPHKQSLTLLDRQRPKQVDAVQFIAHIDTTSIKFDRHGGLQITLVIPPEFAELGLDVRFMAGIPLSVDVQKWVVAKHHPSNGIANSDG